MMNTIKVVPRRLLKARRAGTAYVDRAVQDLLQLSHHEVDAISGHWSEVGERIAVARRARDVLELLRDQIDLLPETKARLSRNRLRRRALVRGLIKDLIGRSSSLQAA